MWQPPRPFIQDSPSLQHYCKKTLPPCIIAVNDFTPPYFKQQHRALALKSQKLTLDLIEFMFYNSLSFGFSKQEENTWDRKSRPLPRFYQHAALIQQNHRKRIVPNCFTKKTNPHSLGLQRRSSSCRCEPSRAFGGSVWQPPHPFIQETPPEQHATSALLHKNLCGLGGFA